MKKKILLSIVGSGIFFFSYAQEQNVDGQNRNNDGDNVIENNSGWNADTLNQREVDSLYSESGPNPNLDELGRAENDTVDYALPRTTNDNDAGVPTPYGTGRSSPGPSRSGAFDTDGKVNGKMDAKGQPKQEDAPSTRNPESGQP